VDRPLDDRFRRRRLVRRVALVLGGITALVVGLGWGAGLLRPTVSRNRIRTARVDVGPVEAVIAASGTVVPEIEQVVSVPVDARVLKIRKRPGDAVARGEAIVDLDLSAAQLEREKLDQELALRMNRQARTRLDLQARLIDFESQHRVKALQLAALQAQTARDRQLHDAGMLANQVLAQSELAETQAAVELERITEEARQAGQATQIDLRGLALEMATLRRERAEARRQLELATTRADRAGIVTWTVAEEGAAVHKGDTIARVADLGSYRVDATVSDVHAQQLTAGLPVIVKVSETDVLHGTVSNVHPTIREGVITFSVALEERSSPLLRSNLRVDALVVTSRKDHAVRVARGPFADGDGAHQVFLVRGARAVRTPVRLGITGADRLEVLEGMRAGDEAVISDMTDFLHLAEVEIR
jgi:HlyD family secretion protein